jgi:hypothetical protein
MHLRGCDNHLGVNKFLLKDRVFAFFIRGCDDSVSLILEPLPQPKFILSSPEEARLLFRMDPALLGFY